jgi:hypothetical protein
MAIKKQQIRTTPEMTRGGRFKLGGWLSGPNTYIWFGERDIVRADLTVDYGRCLGTLGGQRLYRLAKAIVRHFEEGR